MLQQEVASVRAELKKVETFIKKEAELEEEVSSTLPEHICPNIRMLLAFDDRDFKLNFLVHASHVVLAR